MQKLYAAIGYSENEVITSFPKEVCTTAVKLYFVIQDAILPVFIGVITVIELLVSSQCPLSYHIVFAKPVYIIHNYILNETFPCYISMWKIRLLFTSSKLVLV